jgi:hypothetical protein
MSKEKTVNIDGLDVKFVKFNPSIGLPILSRLQSMLGGAVVKLASGAMGSESEQVAVIAEALDEITKRVDPVDLQKFFSDIITSGYIFVNGNKVTHIDDLAGFEDSDPYYLIVMMVKEQLTLSFGGFLKKFITAQGS